MSRDWTIQDSRVSGRASPSTRASPTTCSLIGRIVDLHGEAARRVRSKEGPHAVVAPKVRFRATEIVCNRAVLTLYLLSCQYHVKQANYPNRQCHGTVNAAKAASVLAVSRNDRA